MAPPPSTTIPPFIGLIVRVVTVICLLISLILIASNTRTVSTDYGDLKIKFKDFYAYRYLISTVVIGLAYSLLQTAFSIFLVTTGNRLGGEGFCLFDFYGDKFMSHFLVTGAAASFGMTEDLRRIDLIEQLTGNKFLATANAAASLCFLGFFFTAVSSVFSSYGLPRKAN